MKDYKLWKDNRLDQEFTISRLDLQKRFADWLKTKDADWINYYNSERIICFFLTAPDGMSSVFNESDFDAFYGDLRDIIINTTA